MSAPRPPAMIESVRRWAWLAIPLCTLTMAALWGMNLPAIWVSPALAWFTHVGAVAIGVAFIVIPAARSFLANGQPGVLMLGCGILMMDIGVSAMPIANATRGLDTGFAIYNLALLLGAACQLAGVAVTSRRKIRLKHSGWWLAAAYVGSAAAMGLIMALAFAGRLPAFFINGQGGTLVRTGVMGAAVVLFLLTAGLLWRADRRAASPFFHWYALGLVLLAAGLVGGIATTVADSPLQWIVRVTQVWATIYLCVAVWISSRETGTHGISLEAVEEAWRQDDWLSGIRGQTPMGRVLRFGLALAVVAAGWGLRLALTAWVGPGLPTYITFYPAVMVAALLAGFWPGVVATATILLGVDYWLLAPLGQFTSVNPVDTVGLFLFAGMGTFMCAVAELYRRIRSGLEQRVAERTRELRNANAALQQQVELVDPARAEVIASEMQRVLRTRREAVAAPVEPPKRGLLRIPFVAGCTLLAVGLLVLLGWALDVDVLKTVVPGLATMKANTALCFVLAGAALLLRERRVGRTICAAIVCAVAALTLVEYLSGLDLGLDQLLFRDPGNPETVHLGRMVWATALGFLMSGLSLLGLGLRSRAGRWTQQTLAVLTALVGAIAMLGYLYNVPQMYHFDGSASMALHTSLGFVILAVGLIFARPDGLGCVLTVSSSGAQMARRLLPAAIVLPLVLGWFHEMGERTGLFSPTLGAGLLVLAMMLSFGTAIWWIAMLLDRADSARREAETHLRSQSELMDFSHDALIVREMNGAIRFWNNGAAALYGWPAAEALGQRIHVLLRTEGLPPDHETRLERTGHWEGELIHTARAGRRVTVESRKTALRDAAGHLLVLESNRDITARKQAEEALHQSEERYRALVALSPDAILVHQDGRFVYANAAALRLYGAAQPEDLLGRAVLELIHPEDREPVSARMKSSTGGDVAPLRAMRLLRLDGQAVPVESTAAPLDFGGRPAVQVIVRDITARLRAETALRESEAKYRGLFENMEEGFGRYELIYDPQGRPVDWRVLEVNDAYTRHTGIERQRIVGRRIGELFPDALAEYLPTFSQVVQSQAPHSYETFSKPTGRHMRISVFPAGGHFFASTIEDITARKQAEAAVRESELRLRRFYESGLLGVFYWNMNGEITAANDKFLQIIGYTREDLAAGRIDWAQMTPAEFRHLDEQSVIELKSTGVNRTPFEKEYIRKDGTRIPILLAGAMLDEQRINGVAFVMDITARKQAEEERNRLAGQRQLALDAARLGWWHYDPDTQISTWDERYGEIFEVAGHEKPNEEILQRLHPDDRPGVWAKVEAALDPVHPQPYVAEYRIHLPDGRVKWIEAYGTATFEGEGAARRATSLVGTVADITARKQAGEALRHERDLLQGVMNGAKNSHLVYLDRDFNFVRVNETYAATCGYRPEEMIGKNHFALYPDTENEAIFARVRDTGEAFTIHDKPFEFPDQPERGTTYWDWSLTPVKDPAGQVEGLIFSLYETTPHKQAEEQLQKSATALQAANAELRTARRAAINVMDDAVTARRQAEQVSAALRASEERYRSLFASMNEGFAIHEILVDAGGEPMDYRFLDVNPAFEQLTGLKRSAVLGKTARQILPNIERNWIETYGQVALTGVSTHFEDYNAELGRHFEIFAYCPAPKQFAAVFLDITARKQAEAVLRRSRDELDQLVQARTVALAESESKYRELVENANSIILRLTPDHTIAFFNEYAESFFGYAKEEVVGRNVVGTIVPETDSAGRDLRAMMRDLAARPELYPNHENENMRKDGARVWIHWTNKAVRDPQGQVVEVLCIGADITERKRMQLENARYQERLRALAERLSVSEERERWDISRYIHDTIIQNLSLSSMRLGTAQKSLAKVGLERELANLQTTRRLVDDAIAECRTVMTELTPSLLYELGLVPALKELADMIRQRHGIQVRIEEEGDPNPMEAALRGLLFQSVRELIMNALKHAGPCTIRVGVIHTPAGVRINVQDDGRGFDPAREDGAGAQVGGFGLFNIRQRVEGMGGRVEIVSAPGKGATASISLATPATP